MQLNYLRLSAGDQRAFIDEAASRRNVSPVILEKDFWVSWMLGLLYSGPFGESIVFKGGTSLSKVFGAIDRFSEDLDLSLSPNFLGLSLADVSEISNSQAAKWMKHAEAACTDAVRDQICPALEQAIMAVLGKKADGWLDFLLDETTNSPVIRFQYPTTQPSGFSYLNRTVKLEFGSLTDQQPTERHPIRPWLAETFSQEFQDWKCEVIALDVQRTFWEKATILHVEHHRPNEKALPDRFSRHYADTAALSKHSTASKALSDQRIRARVVSWKSKFFSSGWARYDLAVPDTFRLVPKRNREPVLRKDYEAMREMYLVDPPSFDEILAVLQSLETRINSK